MKKGRYVVSLILNFLIVAAVAFAVVNAVFEFLPMNEVYAGCMIGKNGTKIDYLFEFGVLAGIFGGIAALISVISDIVCLAKKKPTSKFVSVIKMVSAGLVFAAAFKFFVIDSFGYKFLSARNSSFGTANYDLYRAFLLDWHWPLFISVVAPALIIVDYVFFELDPKVKFVNVLWSFIPGVLYFAFIAIYDFLLVAAGKASLPDHFVFTIFNFHKFSHWYYIAIIIAGGILGIVLATIVLFALRALVRKCAVKEEEAAPAKLEDVATKEEQPIKDEASENAVSSDEEKHDDEESAVAAAPAEEKIEPVVSEKTTPTQPAASAATTPSKTTSSNTKTTTKTAAAPKKTGKKVIILKTEGDKARAEGIDIRIDTGDEEAEEAAERKAEAKSTYKSVPRVYHISKQPSGKWQVKLATGERAIKLFDTQQQAIVYAKSLVRTQGGSIRIHAVSGKMRKE